MQRYFEEGCKSRGLHNPEGLSEGIYTVFSYHSLDYVVRKTAF